MPAEREDRSADAFPTCEELARGLQRTAGAFPTADQLVESCRRVARAAAATGFWMPPGTPSPEHLRHPRRSP